MSFVIIRPDGSVSISEDQVWLSKRQWRFGAHLKPNYPRVCLYSEQNGDKNEKAERVARLCLSEFGLTPNLPINGNAIIYRNWSEEAKNPMVTKSDWDFLERWMQLKELRGQALNDRLHRVVMKSRGYEDEPTEDMNTTPHPLEPMKDCVECHGCRISYVSDGCYGHCIECFDVPFPDLCPPGCPFRKKASDAYNPKILSYLI